MLDRQKSLVLRSKLLICVPEAPSLQEKSSKGRGSLVLRRDMFLPEEWTQKDFVNKQNESSHFINGEMAYDDKYREIVAF